MSDIDPFEARLLFVSMLDNLNGAQPTIERVSSFAVKNSQIADDLFDCIQTKLQQLAVTPRLNLFLVLDAILQLSTNHTTKRTTWVTMIKQELVQLIKSVIPEGPAGDGNVPQVRKVVNGWKRKRVVTEKEVLEEIDRLLRDRVGGGMSSETGMKYQDILKRIEQDRDRHKRHKVDVWIRPPGETLEGELEAYWENCSDFNDDDWQEICVDMKESC